jgi:hypothetical protein
MNTKGFNLFTALLATILIVVTSMLVLIMIQTERDTNTTIEDITTQARLEAVMRLMRADVLHSFNHYVREKIEAYLSENPIDLGDLNVWNDWDTLVKEFVYGYFGRKEKGVERERFAYQLATSLPAMLYRYTQGLKYEARYEVRVVGDEEKFKKVMLELILESAEEKDFIQLVDCDGTPEGCPVGSFYINLRLSKLSDELYESLPVIVVKDTVTGAEIRDAILPRHDIKMYVPSRLFKAFAYTRKFLHSDLKKMNSSSDYGYLAPRIHNELDSMALGLCDYGYCHPRENPYYPPRLKALDDKACPGARSNAIDSVEVSFRGKTLKYNPSEKTGTQSVPGLEDALEKIIKMRLCELSKQHLSSLSSADFSVEKQTVEELECYLEFSDVDVESTASVKVVSGSGAVTYGPAYEEPNNPSACPFNFSLPQNRRLGYYLDGDEIKWPSREIGADTCKALYTGLSAGIKQKLRRCERAGWGCCSELAELTFKITFHEGNDRYKVNKNRDVKFIIQITDRSYTPFNPNYDSGNVLGSLGCALEHEPKPLACDALGWTCKTVEIGAKYAGCYPSR